jgi:peptidyl-prolyl cis-trans isomerase B (cyclophilin B)
VARTRTRERALARAKLERQIARRAAAARKRRQVRAGVGAVLALALVLLGAAWATGVFKRDQPTAAAADCSWSPQSGAGVKDVGQPPTTGIPKSGTETMTITTNHGVIQVAIDAAKTPCAAASFSYLAGKQFFDNTRCHRLTNSGLFVLQCGDPSGSGAGGPGYHFKDENLPEAPDTDPSVPPSAAPQPVYRAGMVALANSGADTNSSQFFIVYRDSQLDPKYSVLGTVTSGLDVVDKIAAGGIAEGGTTANDGPPKTEVIIQTLTVSPPQPAGSAPAESPTAGPSPTATP